MTRSLAWSPRCKPKLNNSGVTELLNLRLHGIDALIRIQNFQAFRGEEAEDKIAESHEVSAQKDANLQKLLSEAVTLRLSAPQRVKTHLTHVGSQRVDSLVPAGRLGNAMKRIALVLLGGCFFVFAGTFLPRVWGSAAQSPASGVKPTVYVSDFELDVAPPNHAIQALGNAQTSPISTPPTAAGARAQRPGTKPLTPEQEKHKHAHELVNWMSVTLMAELQKAGYTANRLPAGDGRPGSGVAIRGLFAEIDNENHWHRALIRGADDSGKMQAVVSVANLARPEQAMYEIAPLPGNEAKPGAVITLSPYVPLTKYEIDKQADQAAFQIVASHIVRDLTELLAANPAAWTQ